MSPLSRSSHALVTGGGRGIGLAIATALSKAGATVTVLGRNRAALDDPLGNGLLSFTELADGVSIRFEQDACVTTHTAGYVGLVDGKALLIAPFKVRLYPNNHDGLRGLNCLAELELPSIDVI